MANRTTTEGATGAAAVTVEDLRVDYRTADRRVRALRGVTLHILEGEIFGIAGESGCGKSTLAQALAGLLPAVAEVRSGRAVVAGHDMVNTAERDLRTVRWAEVAIVPQSAMNSLSPVLRVGDQIADAILAHEATSRRATDERVLELLTDVGLDPGAARMYPHEFSGGMRQRAVIAMALALRPSVLILDEPTTALDVVTQQSILSRIIGLQNAQRFTVVLVSHDLPLLVQVANRIAVMYAGKVVELGEAVRMWRAARHPYTRALMGAFPPLHGPLERLVSLPGSPPDLRHEGPGCAFAPRCAHVQQHCREVEPSLMEEGGGGRAACHLLSGAIRG